jgi:hypothetical protein
MRDAGMVFHHLVVRVPRLGARVPGGCPGDPIGGGGGLYTEILKGIDSRTSEHSPCPKEGPAHECAGRF